MSRHLRVDVLLIGLAVLVLAAAAATVVSAGVIENTPPYIHQCSRLDPKLLECYVDAIMHIRPWLAKGIPEASVPPSEPFRLAELSLSLTRGPGGYSVHLRDIDVSGISNFTVRHLTNFVLEVAVAELTMVADYSSSGVLILIPASGRGVLHGVLKGVRVVLAGSASVQRRGAHDYVHLDKMVVDIKVRNPQLRIDRAPGQNSVVATATNLLLKTNSHLVLNAMLPELRVKLAEVFLDIANNIFEKIPVSLMVRDW